VRRSGGGDHLTSRFDGPVSAEEVASREEAVVVRRGRLGNRTHRRGETHKEDAVATKGFRVEAAHWRLGRFSATRPSVGFFFGMGAKMFSAAFGAGYGGEWRAWRPRPVRQSSERMRARTGSRGHLARRGSWILRPEA
jgi:hypothetical protein